MPAVSQGAAHYRSENIEVITCLVFPSRMRTPCRLQTGTAVLTPPWPCWCREDVETAVRTLAPLGGGFQIRTVGERSLIQSVPTELNDDHMSLLNRLGVRWLSLC